MLESERFRSQVSEGQMRGEMASLWLHWSTTKKTKELSERTISVKQQKTERPSGFNSDIASFERPHFLHE